MFYNFLSYPGGKRRLILTAALLTGTIFSSPAMAQVDPQTTPTGENLVSGQATFSRPAAGTLDVNQTSERAIINWENFDIGETATATFNQPTATSLAVNRVTRAGPDPTQILGKLNANGNVMVLDPNGVIFGENSVIDVGSIIASTGDVLDADITDQDGKLLLSGIGPGTIENNGTITVADAGLAALVAPTVRNAGIINANAGRVSLGAGTTDTVDFFGDDLISLAVDDELQPTQIDNTGRINAADGTVSFTTAAAEDVVDNVINTGGIVNATSASVDGLKIVLTGTPQPDTGTGIDLGRPDIKIDRSESGRSLTLSGALAETPTGQQPPALAGPDTDTGTGTNTGTDPGTPPDTTGTTATAPTNTGTGTTTDTGTEFGDDTGTGTGTATDDTAPGDTGTGDTGLTGTTGPLASNTTGATTGGQATTTQ